MNRPVNKPLGKLPAMLLLAVAGLLPAAKMSAADAKPALTIAFAGYDQLTADLKVIDKIDSHFGLAEKLEGFLQAATQGKKLAGLDKSRPWGVLVTVGESDDPVAQGYLPVSDLKQLIAGLPARAGRRRPTTRASMRFPVPPERRSLPSRRASGRFLATARIRSTRPRRTRRRTSPNWPRST